MTTTRTWLPEAVIGLVVTAFGLAQWAGDPQLVTFVIVGTFALACVLCRQAPGIALGLVWLVGVMHVLTGTGILYTELFVGIVAFGASRWGSTTVVWLSGASIPISAALGVLWVFRYGLDLALVFAEGVWRARNVTGYDFYGPGALVLSGVLLLAVPWLAGLVLRSRAQAERSRQLEQEAVGARAQAEEIASLRERQTRMAHDVHDVVGHSLAVILAQAESAQFLPDGDPERLKQTMANIATSARQSLRDVRQVLSSTDSPSGNDGGLDKLVEGVQGVRSSVVGSPRPLPPEIESVAYRTLQEMLTNAIKHGVPGEPVTVIRHWAEQLTLSVENRAAGPEGEGGLGLAGMRVRVESVGGRLDVRREGDVFTATAWLPVRHA